MLPWLLITMPVYLWDGGISIPSSQNPINSNVTDIVKGWLSGIWSNHGLLMTDFAIFPAQAGDVQLQFWSTYTATLRKKFEEAH